MSIREIHSNIIIAKTSKVKISQLKLLKIFIPQMPQIFTVRFTRQQNSLSHFAHGQLERKITISTRINVPKETFGSFLKGEFHIFYKQHVTLTINIIVCTVNKILVFPFSFGCGKNK